jgi:selenocysteine lyase/cysteine desulfurase
MTFEQARAQFAVLDRFAYLNAGTTGPLARSTAEAMIEETRLDLERGRGGAAYHERMLALRDEARAGLAEVLGAGPSSVALVESTSRGCMTVLAGLGLTADDEVVTTDQEHFGLIGPLHATGARIVVCEADEDAILAAVTPRTRLVATSHVLWTTGRRLDLARIRRESGVPMLADGAQGAGAIPVDVSELDFYTVSAQKWLCGPDPAGALYVRDPDALRVAMPSSFAQTSYEHDGAFAPKEGAQRFDSGWIGPPALRGIVAALAVHPEWRYERAAATAARCAELLASHVEIVTPPNHSTLVSFRPNGDPAELVAALYADGVVVRELPGRNLVRASVGWWTNEDDLQRLVAGLAC